MFLISPDKSEKSIFACLLLLFVHWKVLPPLTSISLSILLMVYFGKTHTSEIFFSQKKSSLQSARMCPYGMNTEPHKLFFLTPLPASLSNGSDLHFTISPVLLLLYLQPLLLLLLSVCRSALQGLASVTVQFLPHTELPFYHIYLGDNREGR